MFPQLKSYKKQSKQKKPVKKSQIWGAAVLFRVANAFHLSYPPLTTKTPLGTKAALHIAAMASREDDSHLFDDSQDGAKTPPQIARAPSEPEPAFLRQAEAHLAATATAATATAGVAGKGRSSLPLQFWWRLCGSLVLLLLSVIGYKAAVLYRNLQEPFDSAKEALVSDATVSVVKLPDGHILFMPSTRACLTHGVAYLPGALVNHLAYAPLCREIARLSKLPVLLVRVNLRLAELGKSWHSALETHATTAAVGSWVLGGHSMGGVAASKLANVPTVCAIFLHAAYPMASVKDLPVLQVRKDPLALSLGYILIVLWFYPIVLTVPTCPLYL